MATDQEFMLRTIALARKATGRTSPNPMVGALLVKGGKVIAEGYHRRCGADHAEVVALKKAGTKARGATLYVNLEPCFHQGRTPPCVDAVIAAGIREVVIAHRDPNPLTRGKSVNKLRRSGISVRVGVCRHQAVQLNEAFLTWIEKKRPFIAVKSAQTLDGKIATSTGHSKWITSPQARAYARKIRDRFDAILVGSQTVCADDPGLNAAKKSKHIKKIILDTSFRISLDAQLFQATRASDCLVVTTTKAPTKKIKQAEARGICCCIAPLKDNRVDIKWAVKELAKKQILSILIEGGAHVIGAALDAHIVDQVYCYIAPKIMADGDGLSAAVGIKKKSVEEAIRLTKLELKQIGQEVLIKAYVLRNR